jgi:hypothetical protein
MTIGLSLLSPGNYQLAHGLELRVARVRDPLERDGLGGGGHCAGLFEAAERGVMVHRAACGQCIDREENVKPRVQEIKGRLGDTDVRLHTDKYDVRPTKHLEFFQEDPRTTTTERGFGEWRLG